MRTYLHTVIFEGIRPGEADALRWTDLDFQSGTILIDDRWNVKVRSPRRRSMELFAPLR